MIVMSKLHHPLFHRHGAGVVPLDVETGMWPGRRLQCQTAGEVGFDAALGRRLVIESSARAGHELQAGERRRIVVMTREPQDVEEGSGRQAIGANVPRPG